MKETDLMIGDWVMFLIDVVGGDTEYDQPTEEYQPAKVHTISSWEVGGEVKNIDGVVNDPEQLQPIPLTEEILVKNGFVQYGSKFTYGEISVIFTIKGFSFWTKHMINIAVDNGSRINNLHRYVHELQHALRLCGIEKEIKL